MFYEVVYKDIEENKEYEEVDDLHIGCFVLDILSEPGQVPSGLDVTGHFLLK